MAELVCRLCRAEEVKVQDQICGVCARRLGIIAMPPPRRPPAPCTRCGNLKFVRTIPREYTTSGGEYPSTIVAPMTLTSPPRVFDRIWSAEKKNVIAATLWEGIGMVETYACLNCGFLEWYCFEPERIPIGPEFMADLVDYDTATPYR